MSYSYANAELTNDAPNLITTINPPGFQTTVTLIDGQSGDRLPGAPEHQGTLFLSYLWPVAQSYMLELDYGVTAISDVLTRTGERGFGEKLSGYAIQDVAAMLSRDQWSLTLFAKNVFDKYAETSATQTKAFVQTVSDANGDTVYRPFLSARRAAAADGRPAFYLGNGALIADAKGVRALKTGISGPNPDILLRHSIDENRNGDQAEDPVFPGSTQTDRKGRRRVPEIRKENSAHPVRRQRPGRPR